MRKLTATLILAVFVLSPLVITEASLADRTKAKGNIQSVDLVAGNFSLKIKRGKSTFQSDDATVVIRNGQPAALADLSDGDRATVSYDPQSMVATRVEARGDVRPNLTRVEGTISSVNLDARTVSILPLREGALVTLNVTGDTSITLDGRPARLDELQRGFTAGAAYNPVTFNAARINAESFAEVRGVIRDVNVGEQMLTIDSTSGELVRLLVSDGTRITLNDRPASLEDLHRGFRVSAVFVETTHLAIRIAAHSLGEVTGHIRDVDPSTATVVISPLVDGPAVELHVTRETDITIGDRLAELGDLREGMAAHAVFNIVSLDALSIHARPLPGGGDDCNLVRAAGAIARVNVDERTLTLDPADGREFLTLNVLERTTITLNGRAARLSDLRAGMRAEVSFCRESLAARSIAASAPDGSR